MTNKWMNDQINLLNYAFFKVIKRTDKHHGHRQQTGEKPGMGWDMGGERQREKNGG